MALLCLVMFIVLPAQPHTKALLQGVGQLLVVMMTVVSTFRTQQNAVQYGLCRPSCISLLIFLPTSGLQALK